MTDCYFIFPATTAQSLYNITVSTFTKHTLVSDFGACADNLSVHALKSVTPCYLVQVPLGVSQEGNGMSRPHADGHGSEAGGRAVQYGLRFYSHPASHRAGGVVGAAGVGVQSVLIVGTQERKISAW